MKKKKVMTALLVFILTVILAVLALFLRYVFGGSAEKETQAEGGTLAEPTFEVFVPAGHKGTLWERVVAVDKGRDSSDHEYLSVFEDGEMQLKHDGVVYRVVRNGEGLHLEKDMYTSPFDTEPALTLQAGEVRLSVSGETLRVEALTDPLGVFANFPAEDLLLAFQPGRNMEKSVYTGASQGQDPHFQPYTEWYSSGGAENGEAFTTQIWFKTSSEGTISGELRFHYSSPMEKCELLWAGDAGAIVRTESRELLFFGSRAYGSWGDPEDYLRYSLVPRYDPCGLAAGHYFSMIKQRYIDSREPADILGMDMYTVKGRLNEAGWTEEPLSVKWSEIYSGEYDYGRLLMKFTKDGRMLVTYKNFDEFVIAYVLIGPEGECESWGGERPGDHTLAEAFRPGDKDPFEGGFDGLFEDDWIRLLDDGRVFIVDYSYEWDEILTSFIYDPKTLTQTEVLKKE